MANITVTIHTYFEDGYYRNNIVNMEIPDKAAEIIREAWTAPEGPMRQGIAIKADWLSNNQSADATLHNSNGTVAGIHGMGVANIVENETITRRLEDDEDDD